MNGRTMSRILVLVDYYLPGWRAGGPIPSIRNMIAQLGDRYEFSLLTRDHDHTQTEPYRGLEANRWLRVGKAKAFYCRPDRMNLRNLGDLIRSTSPDLIFSNSLFSEFTRKLLILRRLHWVPQVPILIAPRGELGTGALSSKRVRKRGYLAAIRLARLVRGVHWQASNEWEARAMAAQLRVEPLVASDIPTPPPVESSAPLAKNPGSVRLAFTARLAPIKNLPFLLRVLPAVEGDIALDMYGPRESGEWDMIKSLLNAMPGGVRATYHGPVPPAEVETALSNTHFSVLPTLDENFGHSVYEALRLGRPVVISDRTSWSGIDGSRAGWTIPLEERNVWRSVLQECVDMDDTAYREMSVGAHRFATDWFRRTDPAGQQARALDLVLEAGSSFKTL